MDDLNKITIKLSKLTYNYPTELDVDMLLSKLDSNKYIIRYERREKSGYSQDKLLFMTDYTDIYKKVLESYQEFPQKSLSIDHKNGDCTYYINIEGKNLEIVYSIFGLKMRDIIKIGKYFSQYFHEQGHDLSDLII